MKENLLAFLWCLIVSMMGLGVVCFLSPLQVEGGIWWWLFPDTPENWIGIIISALFSIFIGAGLFVIGAASALVLGIGSASRSARRDPGAVPAEEQLPPVVVTPAEFDQGHLLDKEPVRFGRSAPR